MRKPPALPSHGSITKMPRLCKTGKPMESRPPPAEKKPPPPPLPAGLGRVMNSVVDRVGGIAVAVGHSVTDHLPGHHANGEPAPVRRKPPALPSQAEMESLRHTVAQRRAHASPLSEPPIFHSPTGHTMFETLDTDHTGQLSRSQVRAAFSSGGEQRQELDEAQLDEAIKVFDADGDGALDESEFQEMYDMTMAGAEQGASRQSLVNGWIVLLAVGCAAVLLLGSTIYCCTGDDVVEATGDVQVAEGYQRADSAAGEDCAVTVLQQSNCVVEGSELQYKCRISPFFLLKVQKERRIAPEKWPIILQFEVRRRRVSQKP